MRSLVERFIPAICIALAGILVLGPAQASAAITVIYNNSAIPAGYLANPGANAGGLAHMLTGGVNGDLFATTPGDYCNYYNTGTVINNQNSFDQNPTTGFQTSTPYSSWQEGDSDSTNVCQAQGTTWGFKVNGAHNTNCTPNKVCGMHHYSKLGGDVRPWSGTSPGTALTVSLQVKAQTAALIAGGGAVGYFCPHLLDTTSGSSPRYIEYCFKSWQSGTGFPGSNLVCADSEPRDSFNVDTTWSSIGVGQPWVTQRSNPGGSAATFSNVPSGGYVTQSVSISAKNLQSVINLINQPLDQPNGCKSRGDSTNVHDYRLVGFETGIEGGGLQNLGGSVRNEQFSITSDTLYAGETLMPGQTLYSASGNLRLEMQAGDGNLVMYRGVGTNDHPWASGTSYPGSKAVMQADGNFVIHRPNGFDQSGNQLWAPVVHSHTNGSGGAYATLQDDANFVVYQGATPLWWSQGSLPLRP